MPAEQPPAGAGQPAVYRHAASGAQSVYHPFRDAFAELCKQAARWTWEPRRADAKAPESWIEMADGSGGLFYYCFVTKARPQSDPPPPPKPTHPPARPCTCCVHHGCTYDSSVASDPSSVPFGLWLHLPLAAPSQAREFEMPSLSLQVTLGLPLGLTANAQADA